MKTKTFLLLCLFVGIGITQIKAQEWPPVPPEGTQSITLTLDWPYWTEVYCGEELVDVLTGTINCHCTLHFVDGNYVWGKYSLHGEATGESGEVFSVKEKDSEDSSAGIIVVQYNLRGDQGNHYIGNLTYDFTVDPYQIVVNNTVCLEN